MLELMLWLFLLIFIIDKSDIVPISSLTVDFSEPSVGVRLTRATCCYMLVDISCILQTGQ